MCLYSEQVEDIEHYSASIGDDWVIQANQMVLMNFWYIEHYGARVGDDIDAKRTISNISNGYSMYFDYKQKN